ncbi:MAG: hypothetical protein AUG49_01345 [Catenulispora sp. 13_1_20CM_3_70_7]|nr:MAG: hypothetical protein AUG49_01345 [Catenulispora sp. 13_1_20CM_3_70_7]
MPADTDEDPAAAATGHLTAEQESSLACGLSTMTPVPRPAELKALITAAAEHESVLLEHEDLAKLLGGVTHVPDVFDQIIPPDLIGRQLAEAQNPRRSQRIAAAWSPALGRLRRLSTDHSYAAAVHSPLHMIAGLTVMTVNPRFLSKLLHAFTQGRDTDPALDGTTPGLLQIRLSTPNDFRALLVNTVEHHLNDYDWSASIERTGVNEPLVAMMMKVTYDDGGTQQVIAVIDGQSRLVSAWRLILGIGGYKLTTTEARTYADKIVGRMLAHDAMTASRTNVNDALATATDSGWAAQEVTALHSRLAPVNLVVGTFDRDGTPGDSARWLTDFLTQIHVRTREWSGGSNQEKAVADALASATRAGAVRTGLGGAPFTAAEAAALSGRLHGQAFTDATGLPAFPVFARAALLEAVLSTSPGQMIRTEIAASLSLDTGSASFSRDLMKIVGVFATRFLRSPDDHVFASVVNAWADGGAVTRRMWDALAAGTDAFRLTRLTEDMKTMEPAEAAQALLANIREQAMIPGSPEEAELAILGGDALMVAGVLTRDRGSKEDLKSTEPVKDKTPYRAKPPTIVSALIAGGEGTFMLGEAATRWAGATAAGDDSHKKFFVPQVTVTGEKIGVMRRGGRDVRATEWDVYTTALTNLPENRKAEIAARQEAARSPEPQDEQNGSPVAFDIPRLQTDVQRLHNTVVGILASGGDVRFENAGDRGAMQLLLLKIASDVNNILIAPEPVDGDPYEASIDEDGN